MDTKTPTSRCNGLKVRIQVTGFLLLGIYLIFTATDLSGQPIPCDGTFYFVSSDRDGSSRLFQVQMDENSYEFEHKEIPLQSNRPRHISAIGYNVMDQYIYGLDFDSYELLRIDASGKVTALGVPENLDTNFEYHAGEMTPDGRRLMLLARNPSTGYDERIYSVNVNSPPNYYAGFFSVVAEAPVALSDITVDPLVGSIYGFDTNHGQIVGLDRTGLTTLNPHPFPIEKVEEGFGGLFFNRRGQMFGIGSPNRSGGGQNILYRIDKARGNVEYLRVAGGTGEDTDGCACSYTLQFNKEITPGKIDGCSPTQIEYSIINRGGIGQVDVQLVDTLPTDWTITEVNPDPSHILRIEMGQGGNILFIDAWTLLLDTNILRITVDPGSSPPGKHGSQAELKQLPEAYGKKIVSDDPATIRPGDSTMVEVFDSDTLRLQSYLTYSCDGDTVYLSVPLAGQYLWNTGSTDSILAVHEDGLYSVKVHSDCGIYSDSINLQRDFSPLSVELGENLEVALGRTIPITFTTNAKRLTSILWQSDQELSCFDCMDPLLTALQNGTLGIVLTDARGCVATDQIQILVDDQKKVFIPNAISPNGDGINDRLEIRGNASTVKKFMAFDRWGNILFQQHNLPLHDYNDIGWDGTFSGQPLPTGVYLWTADLIFPDGSEKHFQGTVTIVP